MCIVRARRICIWYENKHHQIRFKPQLYCLKVRFRCILLYRLFIFHTFFPVHVASIIRAHTHTHIPITEKYESKSHQFQKLCHTEYAEERKIKMFRNCRECAYVISAIYFTYIVYEYKTKGKKMTALFENNKPRHTYEQYKQDSPMSIIISLCISRLFSSIVVLCERFQAYPDHTNSLSISLSHSLSISNSHSRHMILNSNLLRDGIEFLKCFESLLILNQCNLFIVHRHIKAANETNEKWKRIKHTHTQ